MPTSHTQALRTQTKADSTSPAHLVIKHAPLATRNAYFSSNPTPLASSPAYFSSKTIPYTSAHRTSFPGNANTSVNSSSHQTDSHAHNASSSAHQPFAISPPVMLY